MRALTGYKMGLILLTACGPLPAMAHGGGLNAEGCHTQRAHGEYHCHRGASAQAAGVTAQPLASQRRVMASLDKSGPYFRTCSEARAAGFAPAQQGDPGYWPHLDRDRDGVACESSAR